ncbi:MAG: hypothetical protein GY953_22410, partial [bacterium]|nr:hypothetical protein [bacterium]
MQRKDLLLLIVPVGLLALSSVIHDVRGPYHLGLNYDPEYVAYFNSINLATFQTSLYTQHPATTLQIVGASVIVVKWLFSFIAGGAQSLPIDAIANHLSYLRAINIVLVLILGVVSFLAARRVYRLSESLLAAAVFQLGPLVSLPSVESCGRVGPELPLVISAVALMIPLAPILVGPDPVGASRNPRLAIWAGILVAAGIASKANFFTLGLLVFLFPGKRQKLRFLVACGVALALLLLPIITALPEMVTYFISLGMHAESWGRGTTGLPSLSVYLDNLARIYNEEPYLVYFLGYYLVVFTVLTYTTRGLADERLNTIRKLLLLGSVTIVIHLALSAKLYQYHYVLPAALVTVLVNTSLVCLFLNPRFQHKLRVVLMVVGILLVYEGLRSNYYRMDWYRQWKVEYQQHITEIAKARDAMPECVTIGFFRSSLPTSAFSFGNDLSGMKQREALATLYPDTIHHLNWGGGFRSWSGEPRKAEVERLLSDGRCVLLQGETSNLHLVEGFEIEPVLVSATEIHGAEGLYKLAL